MLALGFLSLALAVAAAPPTVVPPLVPLVQVTDPGVSLAITRRIQRTTQTLPEIDRARAAQRFAGGRTSVPDGLPLPLPKRQTSLDVTNVAVAYVADVGVGSPLTKYSLIIDTGSSNTWVGAGKAYNSTSSSKGPAGVVQVTYGSGFFVGLEFEDTISFTDELVISDQSIGNALLSNGFDGFDGILGIGPTDLTEGTVFPTLEAVPTVTDNLFAQNKISQKEVGIYFAPPSSAFDLNGEMTFGSADLSKVTSAFTYAPITSESPANKFFGIDQTITYGNERLPVLSNTSGIVDTGTTLLMLETTAYDQYTSLTGATLDEKTGLLSISSENYANLQSLFFNIAGTTFEFTKNAQIWPRALNADIGGDPDDILLIVADLGPIGGKGIQFINGMSFLERFYSLYDSTNNRVGFATTAHTFSESN